MPGKSLRSMRGVSGRRYRFVGLSINSRNGQEVTARRARGSVGKVKSGFAGKGRDVGRLGLKPILTMEALCRNSRREKFFMRDFTLFQIDQRVARVARLQIQGAKAGHIDQNSKRVLQSKLQDELTHAAKNLTESVVLQVIRGVAKLT